MLIYFEIATLLIILFAFAFAAVNLFRKGRPLYFQILTCAIGCCLLFNMAVITMSYCNVNETLFNTSFFGLFACTLFLFCANRGALENLFEKPKTKFLIISIIAGVIDFAIVFIVGWFYFNPTNFVFYAFLVVQLPGAFVVYFITKRLLSPKDELGMKKCLLPSDIFALAYCVFINLDIATWLKIGVLSGIGDLITALIILGLSISVVKGAKKWNF